MKNTFDLFNKSKLVLVTGVTGYVGNRLVYRLLEQGYNVRVLTRDPLRISGRPWINQVEVCEGDALLPDSLDVALKDVSVAYFLIHGRQVNKENAARDVTIARNFTLAASKAKIDRIIYLGELVDPQAKLSSYIRSRHETGYVLRQGLVPVTEFRTSMIIGSGSALFEMVRFLVEREPVLICPRWFYSKAQPIAIRNVLDYLVGALDQPESLGKLIEIGGQNQLSYAEMLLEYARARGLKRTLIPTPFYFPKLSAYWVHMVTPITYNTVLPLIEGLKYDSIVNNDEAGALFPEIEVLDFDKALHFALVKIEHGDIQSSWRDALVTSAGDIKPYEFHLVEGMYIERRQLVVDLPNEAVFGAFTSIGGDTGWLYMDWSWRMRGWLDKIVGGVGLRRGRRHPTEIIAGESLDFWRVEAVEPGRSMRLHAEMKLPGKAWLEFESIPQSEKRTLLTTTAYFDAHGFFGFIYWYAMWPFHKFIFDGLTREIGSLAHKMTAAEQKH